MGGITAGTCCQPVKQTTGRCHLAPPPLQLPVITPTSCSAGTGVHCILKSCLSQSARQKAHKAVPSAPAPRADRCTVADTASPINPG